MGFVSKTIGEINFHIICSINIIELCSSKSFGFIVFFVDISENLRGSLKVGLGVSKIAVLFMCFNLLAISSEITSNFRSRFTPLSESIVKITSNFTCRSGHSCVISLVRSVHSCVFILKDVFK